MIYEDKVYGKVEITEPVVLSLINSKAFQRLKGIDQGGYSKPFFPFYFTRYEHSLGVYLLLKKYDVSLQEQIAGLIHDVSHSCFSHGIDYALAEGSGEMQDHQDKVFKEFVLKTEIPLILKKHKLSIDYILNEENFPLKEKEIPDLCADRIDYSLRTAIEAGLVKKDWVLKYFKKLKVVNNNWVFEDVENARNFAQLFLKLNREFYAGLNSAVMFSTAGDWLAYGLLKGYIDYQDLYTTDKFVVQKISKYIKADKKLTRLWRRLNNKVGIRNNPKNYDKKVAVKSRIVDPLFLNSKKEIIRFSQIEVDWRLIVKKELRPKKYYLKFDY